MTQQGLFSLFLFLHVLGAIIAFGPALAFGVIGPYAAREREHTAFATRLTYYLMTRVVIPVGLTLPITGVLMILTAQIDLSVRQNWWLGLGIILYAIAILYAIFVQAPAVARLIEMSSGGPPGAPSGPPAAGASSGPPAAGASAALARAGAAAAAPGADASIGIAPVRPGPPPHIAAAIRKVQRGGIFLSVLIVSIVLLMVVKPQF